MSGSLCVVLFVNL